MDDGEAPPRSCPATPGDPTSALLAAFNTLVPTAPPERLAPILRQALTALLEDGSPAAAVTHKSVARRQRNHRAGDIATWGPLRERILAALAARSMTRRELAAAVKIPHATLQQSLTPKGRAPSRANITRLQRWLKAIEAHANGPAPPGAAGNGSAQPAAEKAYTLTISQRESLAALRALEDERTLRAEVGLATDLIDKAVAGQPLAPKIVSRLSGFLAEHQQPAASKHD